MGNNVSYREPDYRDINPEPQLGDIYVRLGDSGEDTGWLYICGNDFGGEKRLFSLSEGLRWSDRGTYGSARFRRVNGIVTIDTTQR